MSYVAMGRNQCPVCGEIHDENSAVLLHKQFKDIEDQVIDIELCKEHKKLHDQGMLALVGIVPPEDEDKQKLSVGEPERTGNIAHLTYEYFEEITNVDPPSKDVPMVFVDDEVIQMLRGIQDMEKPVSKELH